MPTFKIIVLLDNVIISRYPLASVILQLIDVNPEIEDQDNELATYETSDGQYILRTAEVGEISDVANKLNVN